jgi:hypothetical protein
MSTLLQDIQGAVSEIISTNVGGIKNINMEIHNSKCNHIQVPGYEAFLFDFSKVTSTENLNNNFNYGVLFNSDKVFTEINITY